MAGTGLLGEEIGGRNDRDGTPTTLLRLRSAATARRTLKTASLFTVTAHQHYHNTKSSLSSPCPKQHCGCVMHNTSSRVAGRDKQHGQPSPQGGCLMNPAARKLVRNCHL